MSILLNKIVNNYNVQVLNSKVIDNDKLYLKIYKLLKQMIISMEIPEEITLPTSRSLAQALKVSRSTILRVYDFLILDGLIFSMPSSGYTIKKKDYIQTIAPNFKEQEFENLSEIGKSFLKNNQHIISNSDENLAFSPGLPPLDIFPVSQWKNLSNMYWKEIKFSNLSYSPSSGIEKLKINIANYLNLIRNLKCDSSQVIITSGSLQSLYLLGCVLLNPGEKIFLENPTFPNVKSIFTGLMADIIGVSIDEQGISIDYMNELKIKSKLIHITPSCHYPIGVKMTLERRLQLLEYAQINNSIIIENDYEHELNNWNKPLPSIFSLDKNQRTVFLGTFNRLLHPSLRIGYMVVPEKLKLPIELLLKHSHRFVAPSIQVVLNQFIEKKYLFEHISNVVKTTENRKQFFENKFIEIFKDSDLFLEKNETLSLQLLVKLKNGILDNDIVSVLGKNNISVHSYNKCFIEKSEQQGIILGHSSIPKPTIRNKLNQMYSIINNLSD
ncbi:MAG: PLP-dependent aminotransferase family protein [Candidatus Methylacidiphilales bacterium]